VSAFRCTRSRCAVYSNRGSHIDPNQTNLFLTTVWDYKVKI